MIEEVKKTLGDLKTDMAVIKTDVKYMRKEIEGNGKKGIIEKVEGLETDRDKAQGAIKIIMYLGGLIGIGNIISAIVFLTNK